MKLHEYNQDTSVYYSASDRFVKKINDDIYEVYHIIVIEDNSILNVSTVDFSELTNHDINHYLNTCGLKYLNKENKIVQKHDENQTVECERDKVKYVLADRLGLTSAYSNSHQFIFEDALDLNELLLEHNILHRFDNETLQSL